MQTLLYFFFLRGCTFEIPVIGTFVLLQPTAAINKTCTLQTEQGTDIIEEISILNRLAGWAKKYTQDAINHIWLFPTGVQLMQLCVEVRVSEQQEGRA